MCEIADRLIQDNIQNQRRLGGLKAVFIISRSILSDKDLGRHCHKTDEGQYQHPKFVEMLRVQGFEVI